METPTQVSIEEFEEHVEAAGAEIMYTVDGNHHYSMNYAGKQVYFGYYTPDQDVGFIYFPF
jgi:hypothetical protein